MRLFLYTLFFTLTIIFTERVSAQGFPNPALLSTGQGPQGSLDPIWQVSGWYNTPPNPMGLPYTSAYINNNCAPGQWVNPGSLPPPVNNGNWIVNPGYTCTNTMIGYMYFRLPLTLPPTCNGVSISSVGSYSLSMSGYVDNGITDVYVNGVSTGFSGGGFLPGSQLNFTVTGPWVAGVNYVDVLIQNTFNNGGQNPYGLLLVANTSGSYPNGCPPSISGDTVICRGDSTTLWVAEAGYNYYWSNGATTDSIRVSPSTPTIYGVTVTNTYGYRDSCITHVLVNPLPPVAISPPTSSLCPGDSATLIASGGVSYVWSTSEATTAITVSPPVGSMTYTVTATGADLCTASASASVTMHLAPIPAINPVATQICLNQSTVLTASGGVSYLWSNSANTAADTVSPLINSTYSVTVTDANSCTASTSATVTVNPLPNPFITPARTQICFGNSDTLTASGGVSYVWDNSANTDAITVSPLADSTYTVTVTDANSCSATASKTVIVNPLPIPSVNPAATQICIGNSTTLTAVGGVGFQWSNAANTASTIVSPTSTTTYSVTVTDANTCSATTSGTVQVNPLPTPVIDPPVAQICMGYSDTLTASGGASYVWSTSATTATVIVAPTAATTTYSVVVTDTNNCSNSTSRTVTVIPYMALTLDSTNITCNSAANGTTTLTVASGLPPYRYLWSTNATSVDLSDLTPGPYSVTVTDYAGCTATASTGISQPLPLVLTYTYTDPTCQTFINGNISITVTGGTLPYQYNWSNSAQGTVLSDMGPGSYFVLVTDANNCTVGSVVSLAYIYDFAVHATTPLDSVYLGDTTTISYSMDGNYGAGFVSLWDPAATVSCSSCMTTAAAPDVSTLYQITITNDTGCIATDTLTIYVIPDYSIYVPNVFTPNGDGKNDYFRIYGKLNSLSYLDIRIFDRWGELVFKNNDINFAWDGTFKGVMENPALFIWQLNLTFINGHTEYKKGSLTLIR